MVGPVPYWARSFYFNGRPRLDIASPCLSRWWRFRVHLWLKDRWQPSMLHLNTHWYVPDTPASSALEPATPPPLLAADTVSFGFLVEEATRARLTPAGVVRDFLGLALPPGDHSGEEGDDLSLSSEGIQSWSSSFQSSASEFSGAL